MISLNYAEVGVEQIIKKVSGNIETKKHLNDLGFNSGEKVTLISVLNGDLIVNVKDTKIAISGEVAKNILI